MIPVRKSDMLSMVGKTATVIGLVLGVAAGISWHYGLHSVVIGFLVMAVTRIDIGQSFSAAADLLKEDPVVYGLPRPSSNTD